MTKENKQPEKRYVVRKTHNKATGELRNSVEDLKDGNKASFINGALNNIVVNGNKVTYADGQIANTVTLKDGNSVIYDTDFNGNLTTTVFDKDGNDITGKATQIVVRTTEKERDALKATLKADGYLNTVAKSRTISSSKAFDGLRNWAKKAQKNFEARQAAAAARKRLLDVKSKGYANAEIAINAGASVEEVVAQRKKDEKIAADKGLKLGKEQQKIRAEQRQQRKQDILDREAAVQKAMRERDF